MTRTRVTADVFAAVLDARAVDALDLATRTAEATGETWFLVLASFAAFVRTDFRRSAELADDALVAQARGVGDDAATRVAALGMRGFAAAGWWPGAGATWTDVAPTTTTTGDPLTEAAALLATLDGSPESDVARYLVAEGALACGRLDLAARVVDVSGPLPGWRRADGSPHPFGTLVRIMRVRLLAFRGLIDDADALLRAEPAGAHGTLLDLVLASTATLVSGNAADRGETRALADRVESSGLPPADYLSGGCRLLVAFGLAAIGDVARSARFVLVAGRDADLSAASILDRALGLELLVALAAGGDDLDAVEAWAERAVPWRHTPMAAATVARLDSRVALLAGRVRDAVELADVAVALARSEGRAVEAAEGEIVGSRARVAASESGVAVARLEAAVTEADRAGYRAVRAAAARTLRSSGRRLRPIAGAGWNGLSARECEVALLIARGASNAGIAQTLHLSDHTVRAHVSRVLAAFGAASRLAVAQELADRVPGESTDVALTPRQRAVADALARGLGNAAIADELRITVKTVEKHLTDIRARWRVSTRGEVARLARGADRAE